MSVARLLFACILSLIISPAVSAEIGRHPNDSAKLNAVFVKGEIAAGDASKLKGYLAALPRKPATAVYLDSDGGNFAEAIDMGYVFRAEGVRTVIEGNGGRCLSACAFAFLGGFDKGTGKPWRAKSSASRLAFHAPYPALKKATFTRQEVSDMLRYGNVAASMLVAYFRDTNTDASLLRYALRTRPSQFYEVSNEQAIEIGINVWDEASKKMRYSEAAKAY